MSGEIVRSTEAKRKRGAPKGNQNARKHGFYSKVLDPLEQANLKAAAKLDDGLEQEVAILRTKILSILAYDPRNHKLINEAVSTVGRLLRTSKRLKSVQMKTKNNLRTVKRPVATIDS